MLTNIEFLFYNTNLAKGIIKEELEFNICATIFFLLTLKLK